MIIQPEENEINAVFATQTVSEASWFSEDEVEQVFNDLISNNKKIHFVTYTKPKNIVKIEIEVKNVTNNFDETEEYFNNLPSFVDYKKELDKKKDEIVTNYLLRNNE